MPRNSVPVTNLAQHGALPDATPTSLPINSFNFSRNWRYNSAGFAETTRGYTDAFGGLETPIVLGNANTVATFLFTWTLSDSPALIYYDETDRVLRLGEVVGNAYQETTLSAAPHAAAVAHEWQATEAFGIPIMNNGEDPPLVYSSNNGGEAITLTNWPNANATTEFITSFGAQLIALGYQNSSGGAGAEGGRRVIAISDAIVVPGTLPDWDFNRVTNPSSLAQLFDLSLHTEGDLVSAYEQNGVLFINTTTNVIALTNDGTGIYSATTLPFPNGVIGKNATALIPNGQFNIGNGRMYIHDGTSVNLVGEGKWVRSWFNALNENRMNEVQAIYDPRSTSVWIKTPISTTEQEIWVYNLHNDTISVLDDQQEVEYMLFSGDGLAITGNLTWDTLPMDLTWDTLNYDTWGDIPFNDSGLYINRLLSVGGRNVFVHDEGPTFNGRVITATLRKEDTPLTGNTYSSGQIQRVICWVSSPTSGATISVRVGTSSTVNAPVSYTPLRTLSIDTGEKLDFRKTGRWGAIEFTTQTSGVQLSGYELEINSVQTGR